jgi:hypothetical protein
MALYERRIIKSVTLLIDQGACNVQWANQIVDEDGTVKHESFERRGFTIDEAPVMLDGIENLDHYRAIWEITRWLPDPEALPVVEPLVDDPETPEDESIPVAVEGNWFTRLFK